MAQTISQHTGPEMGRDQPERRHPNPAEMAVLRNLAAALDKNDGPGAVRLLTGGIDTHTLPGDGHLASLLLRALGKDRTASLADAYATHPCFYCSGGMSKCESCEGTGHTARGLCDVCLGLGRTLCDVCNGSGWATFEFVPTGLLLAVIVGRVRYARAKIQDLLGQPIAPENPADPLQAAKDGMRLLVDLNRMVAALENAVFAFKLFVPLQSYLPESKKKIVGVCTTTAHEADLGMQAALRRTAEAAQHHAQGATGTPAEENANRIAEFYERLAKAGLAGTRFDHPLFHQSK